MIVSLLKVFVIFSARGLKSLASFHYLLSRTFNILAIMFSPIYFEQ